MWFLLVGDQIILLLVCRRLWSTRLPPKSLYLSFLRAIRFEYSTFKGGVSNNKTSSSTLTFDTGSRWHDVETKIEYDLFVGR